MEWLEYEEMRMEPQFAALLYHRQRPCANPAPRAMMNQQQAIALEQNHGR
jgi:hypothetical protein